MAETVFKKFTIYFVFFIVASQKKKKRTNKQTEI